MIKYYIDKLFFFACKYYKYIMSLNIKPCYWGKKYWGTIFSILSTYPEKPDRDFINSVKMYFFSLRHLLCCQSCRESYTIFSSQHDTDIKKTENFSTRDNAILFVYRLRNKVNSKIGLDYKITPEYFKKKLDKMVCVENNTIDGYINELSEAPFIQDSMKHHIYNYLNKNQDYFVNYDADYSDKLTKKILKFVKNPKFDINNKNFKLWLKRNQECRNTIEKIYTNMSCGEYNMLQSFYKDKEQHLKLFYMGCSIIPLADLEYVFKVNKKK